MKQTQADFERGYRDALKDIEGCRRKHPDWDDFDIRFDLGYLCPYFPSFQRKGKGEYVVIRTKYGLDYQKAIDDKLKEVKDVPLAKNY